MGVEHLDPQVPYYVAKAANIVATTVELHFELFETDV